ncbi:MAG: FixH family protein, partial [Exiguobacterium oxidotolerans]
EEVVRDADFVHFEIWKADGTLTYGMEPAETEQDGVYAIQKALPKPGLYYMKVHVGKRNEMIMPTKQFIIGELSKADLKLLQAGAKPSSGNEGHHH